MDYAILKNELTADPQHLGYAAKASDREKADLLNAATRTKPRESVSAADLLDCFTAADRAALKPELLAYLENLLAVGSCNPNSEAVRDWIAKVDADNKPVGAKLAALQTRIVSRAEELGLAAIHPDDVALSLGARPLVQDQK